MWPPHGPMARGIRGLAGSKPIAFRSVMVGADGYGFDRFGRGPAEGFAMPDMFTVPAAPSHGFPPYGHPGPRFAGPEFAGVGPTSRMNFAPMDGPALAPRMGFHGGPPQPNGIFPHGVPRMMAPGGGHAPLLGGNGGPNGMVGAGRLYFMGGLGVGRPDRPMGMPYRPPQGGNNGKGRRDLKRRRNEHNNSSDRLSSGIDQRASGKAPQMQPSGEGLEADSEVKFHGLAIHQRQDEFRNNSSAVNNDEDSESEDEAPRRSRHGESKKKRHDWDGEEGDQADHWELPLNGDDPENPGC